MRKKRENGMAKESGMGDFPRKQFESVLLHSLRIMDQNREYLQMHLARTGDERTRQALEDMGQESIRLEQMCIRDRASRPRSRCSSSARWTAMARRASGFPRPSRLRNLSGGISAAETKKHSPSGGAVRHTVLPEGECCCLERIIPWSRPGEPHRRFLLPSGGRPAPGRSGAPWRLPASA